MVFVPIPNRSNYISPNEIARAVWDEKERREEELRQKAEKERIEAKEKSEEDKMWEELGREWLE